MWVDVSGGNLYLATIGEGAPILLIHGWPLDHRIFSLQIGPLSQALNVIAYDRRGFGQSEAPPNLRLELDDIDRILDALSIDAAHVLGMSQGGRIALRYAATRPQRIRSLILQGAVVDGLRADEEGKDAVPVAEYARLARAGRLDEVKARWLAHPMMGLPAACQNESRLIETIIMDYTGEDLLNFKPQSFAFTCDLLAALSDFAKPVLILTGVNETETRRAHAAELLRCLPNCQEVILKASGHMSNLTEPEIYNETVIRFCQDSDRC